MNRITSSIALALAILATSTSAHAIGLRTPQKALVRTQIRADAKAKGALTGKDSMRVIFSQGRESGYVAVATTYTPADPSAPMPYLRGPQPMMTAQFVVKTTLHGDGLKVRRQGPWQQIYTMKKAQ